MKNIVEIKNVRNTHNKQEGILYLIGSVDVEASSNYNVKHLGLSVFFRPYDEEDLAPQYVKSFVLTYEEVMLMKRGKINIIRDIGYILSVSNTTLDMLVLDSPVVSSTYGTFSTQKIQRATFELLIDGEGYEKLHEESRVERNEMCGFRLAISRAFGKMLNVTDDSIVPGIFPREANVLEFNYNRSED